VISNGTSYTFTLRLNDTASGVGSGVGQGSVSLGITVPSQASVGYQDSGQFSASAPTIGLPSTIVPLSVTSVTFAPGS
jgi:hypothetical protein